MDDYPTNKLKWTAGALRMNQVQLIGTHNSYHRESPVVAKEAQAKILPNVTNYWYAHSPLDVQADYMSVRSFELDLLADPDGGAYARPLVIERSPGAKDPAPRDVMDRPGVKVLHVPDADVWSTCPTLIECLGVLRAWSRAHPDHVPIPVMLEFKTSEPLIAAGGGHSPVIPWNNTALLDDVDAEIRFVFAAHELITPDDLRGASGDPNLTLEQSVLRYGWPDLDSARGRVFFLMDNEAGPGSIAEVYTEGRPSLERRVIFTNSRPGSADCAFQKLNDPTGEVNQANIQEQVRRGYWVRTRADEPLTTLLGDDVTGMRDAALASGAQIVSTDFPAYGMSARWAVDYAVRFPGGKTAICNPVNAPGGCADVVLEPEEYVRR